MTPNDIIRFTEEFAEKYFWALPSERREIREDFQARMIAVVQSNDRMAEEISRLRAKLEFQQPHAFCYACNAPEVMGQIHHTNGCPGGQRIIAERKEA
jgi:hypothetical protein